MIESSDLEYTLRDVIEVLSNQGLLFHLTGGLASSFYGEPRFTQDIDIVIQVVPGAAIVPLISALSHNFIIDDISIRDAVEKNTMFQVLHEATMIKVDFHIGEAIEGELSRSMRVEILPGIYIPLVTKEDAILSKLLWISKGSHKSRQDVRMMLELNPNIDWQYLNNQANKLGVSSILSEVERPKDK